jgi:hypothetical protein
MKAPDSTGDPGLDASILAGINPLADYLFGLSDEHAAEADGISPQSESGKEEG